MAFIDASERKCQITWHFFDEVFSTINVNTLGKVSLTELYKQRAQQLRDEYDYLILNYSGGSDSGYILKTFIENGIKLDQVRVKHPFSLIDKGLHNPSAWNTRPENKLSEWDYTIKPDLEWLAKNHPEIKIQLLDWLQDGMDQNYYNDDLFQGLYAQYFMSNILRQNNTVIDPIERNLLDQGKKVASISGVDKPRLDADSNDNVYLEFTDGPVAINPPTIENSEGTEYFYWSPKMPNLAFEMAYRTLEWYNDNPSHQDILYKEKWSKRYNKRHQLMGDIIRPILYPGWDISRFQVDKPPNGVYADFRPGEIVVETNPEVMKIKEAWKYKYNSYLSKLDRSLTLPNGELKQVPSKKYYIGKLKKTHEQKTGILFL
jgi:hypothetical protein